ncbi:MAG: chromosome segregation protein SMC [Defluviitaleaceae bacterium]|nr:chromosome segregation protein SMC [Defluviitaleaceae bacterium]
MHLKKLELAGFKSFADRTQLTLGTGLNAVVGPNGSGKSNISDALRWVLGEQSAKQLRGGKMEDIIFAGTAHRKPLGFAEIVMRLDNGDKALPVDFPEVTVARRVYRSGESEYSINSTPCRLKDIQMLFMDTGIGRDGYSIIGQGRIDEILSLRSEDRRLVFEEAAGISKYKARRNEALTKLERERQNRARVDDIIFELEEQIPPLEIQAEEANRFMDMRERYKQLHINLFLLEAQKIEIELEKTGESLALILAQTRDGESRLLNTRQLGEELRAKSIATDVRYRQANENQLETVTSIEKTESECKLLESQIAQYIQDHNRINAEIEKRRLTADEKSTEKSDQEALLAQTQADLDRLNGELAAQEDKTSQLEGAQEESAQIIEAHNQAILKEINAVAEFKSQVLDAENRYQRLEEDKEQLNIEITNHEVKLADQQEVCKAAEEQAKAATAEAAKLVERAEAYKTAYSRLQTEAHDLHKAQREAQDNLTAAIARQKALASLEANREGYYQSVKAVLRKKATDSSFSGICGAVSELIGVPQEYETAIEIALGAAAQNIVTETEEDAKLAIQYLKQSREGRATFLPLTAIKGRRVDPSRLTSEPGYIGVASDLCEYEEKYAQVITQVLGNAIIVDNLDNATAMHKKQRYTNKIVTLGGELLSPGGAMTGGSTNRNTSGIVGRGRQLAELDIRVKKLKNEYENLKQQHESHTQKYQATEEAFHRARDAAAELQIEGRNMQDKLSQAKAALHGLHQGAIALNDENERLMAQLIEGNKSVREASRALLEQENAVVSARNALAAYQEEMTQARESSREETQALMELRIEISRQEEWKTQAQANITRLERELKTYNTEISLLEAEIAGTIQKTCQAEENKEQVGKSLTNLKNHLEEVRTELTNAEAQKAELDAAIAQAETDERTHTDEAANLARETTRLEMRKEQLDQNSHRIHNEIWEEYQLTHQQAQAYKQSDQSETAMRRESQSLKSELSTMTDVNLGAVEAYKQLKTRFDFLSTQRDDILGAEESLNELIASLTAQMETQFAQQFALIADHFQEVFKEMFGGGNASLKLQNTENVLESGIEITAQPPGKSLQNMMLLSGGERALTAIALLFAILRLKPSPFCVLDEIESALDDANVSRFAKFLKEYAKGTQFIAITHRKGTMEAADNLYGVTMEEQGVSKLVSVRLTDEG